MSQSLLNKWDKMEKIANEGNNKKMKKEKVIQNIVRCGICNAVIDENENWTETDCVICEACNENSKNEESD